MFAGESDTQYPKSKGRRKMIYYNYSPHNHVFWLQRLQPWGRPLVVLPRFTCSIAIFDICGL